ncbi:MAG: Mannitol dehydrogenase domain protein [Solirubrobacterales bacterium]|nr:Mannitol dehydrogenase domain protein [Solirubrobacterales bacterium]
MIAPLPLTSATLARHALRVDVPSYDRGALAPGVLHLSVGSFHRAHQAVFFDDLAMRGHTDWGIVGVGLRRPHMREALDPQDGLFTVVERGAVGDHARVVGVITRYLLAPGDSADVLDALADPRLRLVTLTVTGSGYKLAGGAIDLDDPEVRTDLETPGAPGSAIGFLVEGLARRRAAGLPPFTVLSCDNLPGNGALARAAVVGLAAQRDVALAQWIDEHGAFPSSMVDRITPRTSRADQAWVARAFGVADRWPVITEPFSQWIVEDDFCNGRPPLDEVGVEFVADVAPHALMKTRLLNASHCVLGTLGVLAGFTTTDEAIAEPLLAETILRFMAEEVAPLLPPVPGFDLELYRASVLERLANPVLHDQLERLCRNGSDKFPTHVLSSLASARAAGRPHELLTLAVAGWVRYLRGTDEAGRLLELDDPQAAELHRLAVLGGADPGPLLRGSGLFGALADDAAWVAELTDALARLERCGVLGALTEILDDVSLAA